MGSLDNQSGAGVPRQRPDGVEDLFLGDSAAPGEGKSERGKYPGGIGYLFLCYRTLGCVILF